MRAQEEHGQEPGGWSDRAGEERLPGGNVGGAVRVGQTVRRPTGPWTPAVHALLAHLQTRLPHVPRVLGFDDQGREVLTYLPGRVLDAGRGERLSTEQLRALVRWTRDLHAATADFAHPGPWRMFPVAAPTLIGHNDIAAYNAVFDGDGLVGVFDWDLAGPTTPLLELAFVAWNAVPMWDGTLDPGVAAERLAVVAEAYGGIDPVRLLRAVPDRIQLMVDGIPVAADAGDAGMQRLLDAGNHAKDVETLVDLRGRIPAIDAALAATE